MLFKAIYVKAICIFCMYSIMQNSFAAPTQYASFKRQQSISYQPNEDNLVRIWMFYVGQGDAMLIQIPESLTDSNENYDVLIDAGPNDKLSKVLKSLYPSKSTIENFVISHHDNDHVAGLAYVIRDDNLSIEHVWHNGLVSFLPDAFSLSPQSLSSKQLIAKKSKGVVQRFMGLTEQSSGEFDTKYIVDDKAEFKEWYQKGWYHDVYRKLAENLLGENSSQPILEFSRVFDNSEFIESPHPQITFLPLWPKENPKKYGDWGETINGNSVSFMFVYDDFEMFFTGDLNEKSEKDLLAYYKKNGRQKDLKADVLKVPHHGSSHNDKDFFKTVSPVLGVASMGKRGFETNWKHPSEDVISFLGGSHRLYSTYIHEKRFRYKEMAKPYRKMRELSHILIETDGKWFRVVEIPAHSSIDEIPSVLDVRTGNGTQWINAKD